MGLRAQSQVEVRDERTLSKDNEMWESDVLSAAGSWKVRVSVGDLEAGASSSTESEAKRGWW